MGTLIWMSFMILMEKYVDVNGNMWMIWMMFS